MTICRKRATATQCRSHRWLTFKSPEPKKIIIEEEVPAIETTKPEKGKKKKKKQQKQHQQPEVLTAEVQQVAASSNIKNELDMTKDNLRLFVERWREHPDSPYAVEQEGGQPSRWEDREAVNGRAADNNFELISLRGQSPSPCGSVCSSPSEVSGSPADKSSYLLSVQNGLMLGLDRRASEGNFANVAAHRRDQAAQIVLAEEIIKLSEHLRNLSSMSQPNGQTSKPVVAVNGFDSETGQTNGTRRKSDENNSRNKEEGKMEQKMKTNETTIYNRQSSNKNKISTRDIDTINNGDKQCNEISEKLSSITSKRKINGTTFNGGRGYEKQEIMNNVTSFNLKKTSASRTDRSDLLGESSFVGLERNNKNSSDSQSKITWRSNVEDDGQAQNDENLLNNISEIDLTPPWRRARTKHRFGETCRDVPRISNLRDIHKSLNLDEPKSTKDLLLHLLGEWDDSTRPSGVGRKSVSVDWCGEESVARRSMNSLAEYFQSEQQKPTTTTGVTTTNASSPTIHR